MYAAPNYASRSSANTASLPTQLQGLIHENPGQDIQGGSSGQHYHLTEREHQRAVLYSEPVMMPDGTYLTIHSGDIVMALANY